MNDTTTEPGWLDNLSSAINSPLVSGLMGMTQGFAQAAMPSRMPIPFGAALGLAAGGMQSGMRNAYMTQLAQQQAEASKMQNQIVSSALPMYLARNKMLTGLWQNPKMVQDWFSGLNATSPPSSLMGVPSVSSPVSPSMGTAPVGSPAVQPQAAAAPMAGNNNLTQNALASVPENMRLSAVNAALKAGLPPDAWPSWIASIHTESGWNPNAPTGAAGEVGIGQVKPATGQMMGVAPDQLADPNANLLASAKYYATKWQEGAGNPMAALTGYNTGNVAGNAPEYVNKALTRLAQWGYSPVGTSPVGGGGAPAPGAPPAGITPQNALATAQWYEQQANKIEAAKDFAKQFGLPIPVLGDPATMRSAAQQYRDLALAPSKAGAVKAAELPYVGAEAAAKTAAEFAVKPVPDRFGNWFIGDGKGGVKYIGRGGRLEQVVDPNTGQKVWKLVGAEGIGAVGGGAAGASDIAEISPTQQHFASERGTKLANQFDKIDVDAASAKDSNYLFDNMRNDSQTWDMGKFAVWEGDARAYLSAIAKSFGVDTPELNRKLADFQTFQKSAGSLLRTAVHDVSSRAAVQEYKMIGDTLPQATSTKESFSQIADQWQGLNDYRLAKQKFAAGYQNKPQDFNLEFNSQISPTSFMLNRMAQSPQGQADMQAMLGRMQQTAEGRIMARHMLAQYRFAKEHGLFENLTPTGAGAENQPPQGGGGG